MKPYFLVSVLILAGATAGFAQQTHFSIFAAQANYQGDTRLGDGDVQVDLDDATGFGGSIGRSFNRNLTAELAVTHVSGGTALADATDRIDSGDLDLTPISVMALWGFGERVRPYVGAGVAYVLTGDVSSDELDQEGIGTAEIDDEVVPVFGAGVAVRLGANNAFRLDARYMGLDPDVTVAIDPEEVSLHLDPLILSLGFQWSF